MLLNNPHKLMNLIMAGAAFGLVLSIWLVAVLMWTIARKRHAAAVEERLKLVPPHVNGDGTGRILRLWRDGQEATTVVAGDSQRNSPAARLRKFCAAAGLSSPLPNLLLRLLGFIGLTAAVAYVISGSGVAAAISPVGLLIVLYIYLTSSVARRRATLDRQLIDAMDLAARSLRVGHPLVGAFRLISEEVPAPIGPLFGEVCQQQQLGMAMDQSLREVADRHDSEDLKFFATSVVIQLRSGGNLADMMERMANVMRERGRLARRVKVLTAQTQLSKRILLALPFFVFILLTIVNPTYMHPLYVTTLGQMVIAAAGVGLLLGWMMMNWLSKLTP